MYFTYTFCQNVFIRINNLKCHDYPEDGGSVLIQNVSNHLTKLHSITTHSIAIHTFTIKKLYIHNHYKGSRGFKEQPILLGHEGICLMDIHIDHFKKLLLPLQITSTVHQKPPPQSWQPEEPLPTRQTWASISTWHVSMALHTPALWRRSWISNSTNSSWVLPKSSPAETLIPHGPLPPLLLPPPPPRFCFNVTLQFPLDRQLQIYSAMYNEFLFPKQQKTLTQKQNDIPLNNRNHLHGSKMTFLLPIILSEFWEWCYVSVKSYDWGARRYLIQLYQCLETTATRLHHRGVCQSIKEGEVFWQSHTLSLYLGANVHGLSSWNWEPKINTACSSTICDKIKLYWSHMTITTMPNSIQLIPSLQKSSEDEHKTCTLG